MSSEKSSNTYQTYLLRLHRRPQSEDRDLAIEHAGASTGQWQLILVHPYTGARRVFDSLEALTFFLQEQMNE